MEILAIYGSPRRKGNTSTLLDHAVKGAEDAGALVEKIVLRDCKMSPCLEIYGCKKTGRCVIKDDFQQVIDKLLSCQGIMLASPIFFLYRECPHKNSHGPVPIPLGKKILGGSNTL